MKRKPTDLLNPKDARPMGTDSKGTLWVDGNAKGIRTMTTTDAYREGWERAFKRKGTRPCAR